LRERACAPLTNSIPFAASDYLGLSAHTPEQVAMALMLAMISKLSLSTLFDGLMITLFDGHGESV
jgi:hypothetical protein